MRVVGLITFAGSLQELFPGGVHVPQSSRVEAAGRFAAGSYKKGAPGVGRLRITIATGAEGGGGREPKTAG